MNFKAHMTLLSWRELLMWMEKRGDEAAALLSPTCLEISDADRRSYNQLMDTEIYWDRIIPSETIGVLNVLVTGLNYNNQEVQFSFDIKEEHWFSHEPLTLKMFKET